MPARPQAVADLPDTVSVFPLSGALLLPFAHRPLNVFEPRYLALVDDALAGDRLIALVQPEDAEAESPAGRVPLQPVGCLGRIIHFEESSADRYLIVLEGVCRIALREELETDLPFRRFRIDATAFAHDFQRGFGEEGVDRERFVRMMRDYALYADLNLNWDEIDRTGTAELVNFASMVSPYGAAEKQALLEAPTLAERAETLIAMAEVEMARGGDAEAPLN